MTAQIVLNENCLHVLGRMPDNSVSAIVTDPPYGLSFMGRGWDKVLPDPAIWRECLRVLKPGGHMVAFGAPRVYHRLAVDIEDQGFEIRDCLMWLYGSGFPKSLNVGKALPAWEGFGTALKPAWEPILLARKPLGTTVAKCVLAHGTGALNIDATRIGTSKDVPASVSRSTDRTSYGAAKETGAESGHDPNVGRWPANLILDEGPEDWRRYFYCAKASRSEREAGLDAFEVAHVDPTRAEGSDGRKSPRAGAGRGSKRKNAHPTVKPLALMRWLVRLVGGDGSGLIMDPFTGSGTTGAACAAEGRAFLGCELDARHAAVARARIAHHG